MFFSLVEGRQERLIGSHLHFLLQWIFLGRANSGEIVQSFRPYEKVADILRNRWSIWAGLCNQIQQNRILSSSVYYSNILI